MQDMTEQIEQTKGDYVQTFARIEREISEVDALQNEVKQLIKVINQKKTKLDEAMTYIKDFNAFMDNAKDHRFDGASDKSFVDCLEMLKYQRVPE